MNRVYQGNSTKHSSILIMVYQKIIHWAFGENKISISYLYFYRCD